MNALTPASKPVEPAEPTLAELVARIKEAHAELRASMRHIVIRAIAIGEDLNLAKKKVGHGNFLKYVSENCEMSDKTAERYMHLAENKEKLKTELAASGKIESISNLSLARAERLITGSVGGGGGGGGTGKIPRGRRRRTV